MLVPTNLPDALAQINALEYRVFVLENARKAFDHASARDFAEKHGAYLGDHVWNFVLMWAIEASLFVNELDKLAEKHNVR